MGQSIQKLSGKDFSDLLKTLKMEAASAHKHGSIVSALTCAAYTHALFGVEINAIVVYSDGVSEQVFKHLSANSLHELECNIDNLATQMAMQGYEITCLTHSAVQTSKLHRTSEAIMVFTKR